MKWDHNLNKIGSKIQARIEWVSQEILVVFHWIDPPKNSQNFVEKAHYSDTTPLKISIRNHSIPVCFDIWWYTYSKWFFKEKRLYFALDRIRNDWIFFHIFKLVYIMKSSNFWMRRSQFQINKNGLGQWQMVILTEKIGSF